MPVITWEFTTHNNGKSLSFLDKFRTTDYTLTCLTCHTFVSVQTQDLDFHISWSLLCTMIVRWKVVVCFVNIGRIADYHCLNFLFITLTLQTIDNLWYNLKVICLSNHNSYFTKYKVTLKNEETTLHLNN